MAVSLGPLSDPRAELTLTEINRELQLQLAKNKQDFRDLTEKFLVIRSQARELTQLRQTLREGKDDSVLLKQHLKDLLTHNDLDNHQGQGFREQLTEGHRLAERLARKLSPATSQPPQRPLTHRDKRAVTPAV
ncbi:putative neuroblastoma breakpoint family member 5 [Hippopotamus amphibius kiboko]|uniref:putative neuroblastoma breakpoint family member 5 n=1 Tax=Hippopotamus amphibius kiboko TaxID=575201 RepID=UPI0025972F5D|nr:putative neuroblastoma breakpoint family member 5 [Hippopotamus amphibius kiboko]